MVVRGHLRNVGVDPPPVASRAWQKGHLGFYLLGGFRRAFRTPQLEGLVGGTSVPKSRSFFVPEDRLRLLPFATLLIG